MGWVGMNEQIIKGTGTLYDAGGTQVIAEKVTYDIETRHFIKAKPIFRGILHSNEPLETIPTTCAFIIELQDKKKMNISIIGSFKIPHQRLLHYDYQFQVNT